MRTAISAGALALTLGGLLLVVAPAPASAATWMGDCEDGGLLGGVTDGLCKAVDAVGTVVNGIAAGPTSDTGGLDYNAEIPPNGQKDGKPKKGEKAGKNEKNGNAQSGTGGLGEENDLDVARQVTSPDPATDAFATPEADDTREEGLLPKDLSSVCSPLTGSPECPSTSAISTPEESAPPSVSPRPSPSRRSRPIPTDEETAAPLPREPLRPPQTRGRETEGNEHEDEARPEVSTPPPVVDAEAPRLELLWPTGPVMRKFQRAVTPTRSSDPLGTALTTALLIAAILAVRVLYARRIGEESIPLEPLRMKRHRTA
ncbi:hypothetical protein AB0395_38175 [Streptosporangium sp. NPDC051023]|uniref:hypothetical protein n=1 Tax=Streptosporangium sp. NPDC051023 TaxID=3155410 RepID=UPI0034505F27